MSRFQLGQAVITPGAVHLLAERDISALALLDRHVSGDWGELEETDRLANEDALLTEGRLLSRYLVGEQPVWIITEADRSATTILLPSEY